MTPVTTVWTPSNTTYPSSTSRVGTTPLATASSFVKMCAQGFLHHNVGLLTQTHSRADMHAYVRMHTPTHDALTCMHAAGTGICMFA
jgi:hypothetical protein